MKTIASTAFAIFTLGTVLFSAPEASAQSDNGGKVHLCVYPGSRAVHLCTLQDYNKLQQQKKGEQRRLQQQKEMDAEARAYKKMQEERKRNAPTTEHCFMKNGELICKPI
jgi:hypothetical protein